MYSFCPVAGSGAVASSAGVAGRSQVSASGLPRRLWQSLAHAAGILAGEKWADVSKAKLSALARQLTACDLQVGVLQRYVLLLVAPRCNPLPGGLRFEMV